MESIVHTGILFHRSDTLKLGWDDGANPDAAIHPTNPVTETQKPVTKLFLRQLAQLPPHPLPMKIPATAPKQATQMQEQPTQGVLRTVKLTKPFWF